MFCIVYRQVEATLKYLTLLSSPHLDPWGTWVTRAAFYSSSQMFKNHVMFSQNSNLFLSVEVDEFFSLSSSSSPDALLISQASLSSQCHKPNLKMLKQNMELGDFRSWVLNSKWLYKGSSASPCRLPSLRWLYSQACPLPHLATDSLKPNFYSQLLKRLNNQSTLVQMHPRKEVGWWGSMTDSLSRPIRVGDMWLPQGRSWWAQRSLPHQSYG